MLVQYLSPNEFVTTESRQNDLVSYLARFAEFTK